MAGAHWRWPAGGAPGSPIAAKPRDETGARPLPVSRREGGRPAGNRREEAKRGASANYAAEWPKVPRGILAQEAAAASGGGRCPHAGGEGGPLSR